MRKSSSSSSQTIKLPLQLASLIHGEAGTFLVESTEAVADAEAEVEDASFNHDDDEIEISGSNNGTTKRKRGQNGDEDHCDTTVGATTASRHQATIVQPQKAQNSLNVVISAAQNRHTKELGSYIRTVCMRMGFVQ